MTFQIYEAFYLAGGDNQASVLTTSPNELLVLM